MPLRDLRGTLIGEIELPLRVDAASSDLAGHYHEAVRFARGVSEPADTLDKMRQQAIDQVAVEIDFAILEASKAQPTAEAVTFTMCTPPSESCRRVPAPRLPCNRRMVRLSGKRFSLP